MWFGNGKGLKKLIYLDICFQNENEGKIYFASDFHLGIDAKYTSAERERQIVRWLDMIKADAAEIYLVGDVFDFWFEYADRCS